MPAEGADSVEGAGRALKADVAEAALGEEAVLGAEAALSERSALGAEFGSLGR
jgi:hypothetical protein